MIDHMDCGSVGGMRLGKGNQITQRKLPQCHQNTDKYHETTYSHDSRDYSLNLYQYKDIKSCASLTVHGVSMNMEDSEI
jgi:hypothetical protein